LFALRPNFTFSTDLTSFIIVVHGLQDYISTDGSRRQHFLQIMCKNAKSKNWKQLHKSPSALEVRNANTTKIPNPLKFETHKTRQAAPARGNKRFNPREQTKNAGEADRLTCLNS
jgi:hypothetical protein